MKLTWFKSADPGRRIFSLFMLSAGAMLCSFLFTGCKGTQVKKPDSNFNGIQVGVISYSWRSMPSAAEDVLNYCLQSLLPEHLIAFIAGFMDAVGAD